jgi:hypothetical protein
VCDGKIEAILESEKYTTPTLNELFSKLKSAEVDRGLTARLESPTDLHSLALIGGIVAKFNTNTISICIICKYVNILHPTIKYRMGLLIGNNVLLMGLLIGNNVLLIGLFN